MINTKLTKKELVEILKANFINRYGDLDLSGLDFSGFTGAIIISRLTTDGDLYQDRQKAKGDIFQRQENAGGKVYQKDVDII